MQVTSYLLKYTILLMMLLLTSHSVKSQSILKQLTITPVDSDGRLLISADYPNKAGLVIQSNLTGLRFESNMDGILAERSQPEQGQYILIIEPVSQVITMNAMGYMQERLRISGLSARDVRYYQVEPAVSDSDLISVIFNVTPADAELTLNDEVTRTNQTVQVSAGTYNVALAREGYQPLVNVITVDENNISFTYTMEQINVIPIRITSNVSGARVLVNGSEKGVIDSRGGLGFFTYPGTYKILLTSPGYLQSETEVTVTEGVQNEFDVQLIENNGDIVVRAEPEDARIFINQEEYTDAETITLEPGTYQLEVRSDGYAPYVEMVDVIRGKTLTKTVSLSAYRGRLQVSVSPSDASMQLIDAAGEIVASWKGLTILNDINEGEYTLLAEASGYSTIGTPVTITRNETTVEQLVMEEVSLAQNTALQPVQFSLNTVGARIRLNGAERGITDSGGSLGLFLLPGEYKVEAEAPQYLSYSGEITVRNEGSHQFSIQMVRDEGELRVSLNPADAAVTIGGERVVGLTRKALRPGTYSLLVEREAYYPYSETIIIESTKTIEREVVLKPHVGSLQFTSTPANAYVSLIRLLDEGRGMVVNQWRGLNILRDLMVGQYVARVHAANHGVKELNIEILKDQVTNMKVVLEMMTEVVNVVNPVTGVTWMDRNLGASRAATAFDDSESYGDLYQWGRAADGHEKRNSPTTSTLSSSDQPGHGDFILTNRRPYDWRSPQNDNLWQGVSGVNNPCPVGYRLPTIAEWESERGSWSSDNGSGAYGSPLKLPSAGRRDYDDGSVYYAGSRGYYWSSTVDGSDARSLYFDSSTASMGSYIRAFGYSVRCRED